MAFTFWSLLEASLLIVNAICVLHEERFLAKGEIIILKSIVFINNMRFFFNIFSIVGWGGEQIQAYGSGPSVKSQILNLIRSVRTVMRSI
jgi:hypothetical protein